MNNNNYQDLIDISLATKHGEIQAKIIATSEFALHIDFAQDEILDGDIFERCTLNPNKEALVLGACRFDRLSSDPKRDSTDVAAQQGQGLLFFLHNVYNFKELLSYGRVQNIEQFQDQLPVLLSRKIEIDPIFRDYCNDLVYELSVRRSLFDAIDRPLKSETPAVRKQVQQVLAASEYQKFSDYIDASVLQLKTVVSNYSRQQHEQHGFYFRKLLWDIIMRAALLERTNIKPRGYAGDSEMMEMIYANDFMGQTLFAQFLHKYAVSLDAAQAVRNRRSIIRRLIDDFRQVHADIPKLSLLSVACGPARELQDLLNSENEREQYALTLLDQDPEALAEARSGIEALQKKLNGPIDARFVQESVRTLLRSPELDQILGSQHVIYSMGLFDYLSQPVARALLQRLYGLLEEGGEIIVGNYHKDHQDRVFMDYWADWVLLYRREEDMRAMCENLPDAKVDVIFEETGCQMFLRVSKQK